MKKLSLSKEKLKKSPSLRITGKLCYAFDFGEYAVKIAVGKPVKGGAEIKKLITVESDDRSSRITRENFEEWRTKLAKILAEEKVFPTGQPALCTVGGNGLITRQLEIPMVSAGDRNALIAAEMEQTLSLAPGSYIFQHTLIGTVEKDGAEKANVWTAALEKEKCSVYYDLLSSLKLVPAVMDIHLNGLKRFVQSGFIPADENGTVLIVDYGKRSTELTFFSGREYASSQTVDSGDMRLVSCAKAVLGLQCIDIHNENKLVASADKVLGILRSANASPDAHAFRDSVEDWITQINNAIKRYNIEHADSQVSSLFICGGSPQIRWLSKYLEQYTKLKTSVAGFPEGFRFTEKKEFEANTAPQFMNALSLFLIE